MHEQWIEFQDGVEPCPLEPGVYEAEVEDRGLPAISRLRRIEDWGWCYDDEHPPPSVPRTSQCCPPEPGGCKVPQPNLVC